MPIDDTDAAIRAEMLKMLDEIDTYLRRQGCDEIVVEDVCKAIVTGIELGAMDLAEELLPR